MELQSEFCYSYVYGMIFITIFKTKHYTHTHTHTHTHVCVCVCVRVIDDQTCQPPTQIKFWVPNYYIGMYVVLFWYVKPCSMVGEY